MVNKLMLVLVVLLWCLAAVGQEARRGNDRLSMNIGYTGFFKNNEYPANYAKGYTLTGNHLTPLLSYHVAEKMTLRAGAHLLKYNGRDSFSEVRPFLGLDLWLTPGFRLTIGSYRIPHQHRLSPILFSDERRFTDYVEEGLRMQYKGAGVEAEAWLHWDQFIFQEDPFQEHFTAGFSGQWTAFSSDLLHGTLYGQFLATHQGGEIDTSPLPVSTLVNTLSAVVLKHPVNHLLLKDIRVKAAFLTYNDVNGNSSHRYRQGSGQLYELGMTGEKHAIKGGAFFSEDFMAPRGHPLFQSASLRYPEKVNSNSAISFMEYTFQKHYNGGVSLLLSLQGFCLPDEKELQYSYLLTLVFDREFFIREL